MSAPIGNTCPDIDSVIESIKTSLIYLESAKNELSRERYDETESYIDSAIREIEDFCDTGYYGKKNNLLEKLRESNSTLRQWGEELEKENEQLQKQIEEMEVSI